MGISRETSLYYYWKVTNSLVGYPYKNFSKFPSLYMDIYKPFCGGVFEDFLYPLTIIGKF